MQAVKLTEARRVRAGARGWGALADYTLEWVRVRRAGAAVRSAAVLRLADRAGRATCALRGRHVALLFGLAPREWAAVEELARAASADLFYRPFRGGLRDGFPLEQRMFYYFCMTRQVKDVLFVRFRRAAGASPARAGDTGPFLEIEEVRSSSARLMELYRSTLPPRVFSNTLTESSPKKMKMSRKTLEM